jgi:hypothetical protein
MDSLKKQNNCIFKGRFNNSMRAVYEDKKIYAKNICFTLVSPLPKKKGSQFPGSLVFVTVVPPLLHFITDGQAGLTACGGINFSPRFENDKTSACAEVFVTTLWSHLDSNQGQ